MQSAKEKMANTAAAAKAGMEKAKATLEEKGERMTTRDPLKKEMATEEKEERKHAAETNKREAKDENAAARQQRLGARDFTVAGATDYRTTGAYKDPVINRDPNTAGGLVWSDHPTSTGCAGIQDPDFAGGARTGYGAGNRV